MSAIKLEKFGGQLPAWDPHLLDSGQAAYSKNGFLFSGALQGWRKPKTLRALNNSAARMVYRIPTISEAQARAYLVFKANPNAGDTVAVGDITYTFVSALTAPFDVLIGATPAITADHFVQALTADSGQETNAGVTYGDNTPLNGDVKYFLPDTSPVPGLLAPARGSETISGTTYIFVLVGANDFGASLNLLTVSESTSAARLTWLYDLALLTHTTTTFRGGTNPSFDNNITGAATWLEFNDPDTNVFRSPIVNDQWNRYYAASPSQMPAYNTYDRILANDPFWRLGIPAPGCAVSVEVSGGGNNLTLGNTVANGADVTALGNTIYVLPFTPTGDTQIQDVQFALSASDAGSTTTRWAAVLYDDNAGVPGSLLNTGQIVTGVSAGNNESSFLNPTNLSHDTTYWLGIFLDTQHIVAGGGTAATASFAQPFSNGPPATASGVSTGHAGFEMWGDFVTSDIVESRAYVYTWVSEYGEEGPPSPPASLDGWSNGVWTLGLWQPPPDDLGVLRNLKKINIYRTVPGQGGQTVFFFVDTVDIGTVAFIDANANNVVALNDQLQSTTWFPPPENLQGVTVLQNGMLAGFIGNEIWFCEPYRPHAWPPAYVLTVDFPIVGMGVTNGTLVVCTAANPFVVSGSQPAQMTQAKCALPQPCNSRASILGGDSAVTYMSPNGLIQVTSSGVATNTTDLWITREKWEQFTPPHDARAIALASCYFCLGSVSPDGMDTSQAQRGFTIELDQDNTSFSIWPQPGGHRLGFTFLDSPTGFDIQNVQTDPWAGIALLVSNSNVYYIDFTDAAPSMQVYTWRSKVYQQNAKRNYQAMKVFFTVPTNTPALNATRLEEDADNSVWDTLPADRWGFIKTYVDVDGTGNFTRIDVREIRTPGELLRIVDGFKCDSWYWEITARVLISNVQIGTSVKALAQV